MTLRFRESHRSTIRHRMYKGAFRRMDLCAAFAPGVLCIAYAIKFASFSEPGGYLVALVLFPLGLGFIAMHTWLLRALRRRRQGRECYVAADYLLISAFLALAALLSGEWNTASQLIYLAAATYGSWRLWRNAHPYWRLWFFQEGRAYFREARTYGHRRARPMKRDEQGVGRPSR